MKGRGRDGKVKDRRSASAVICFWWQLRAESAELCLRFLIWVIISL